MVLVRAMTPQEYKLNQTEFKVIYGFHSTPFGDCLLGITSTDGAVAYLAFVDKGNEEALAALKGVWPLTDLVEDTGSVTNSIVRNICAASLDDSLSVLLKGTEFQTKVWASLMQIPRATTITYEQVAMIIGNPKASRAVGNAVMKNNVAMLVPCHRVKGKSGSNKYKWGAGRKEMIIAHEGKHP